LEITAEAAEGNTPDAPSFTIWMSSLPARMAWTFWTKARRSLERSHPEEASNDENL
jgi:hypothetical protein